MSAWRHIVLFAVLWLPIASGGMRVAAQHPDGDELTRILAWEDTILLEEDDRVVNVVYDVDLDPAGGFLIAGDRETQFRRYSPEGRLVWATGRSGPGPAEFTSPVRAVRLPEGSGGVLLVHRQGKLAVYDEDGDSPRSTGRTGLLRVNDAAVAPDGTVWLATGVHDPARLHMFDRIEPSSGEVTDRAFAPWPSQSLTKEARYMTWSATATGDGETLESP